jgi:hypothetical protein
MRPKLWLDAAEQGGRSLPEAPPAPSADPQAPSTVPDAPPAPTLAEMEAAEKQRKPKEAEEQIDGDVQLLETPPIGITPHQSCTHVSAVNFTCPSVD